MTSHANSPSRGQRIESRLRTAFEPAHLEVVDESGQHNVPRGAESHFRVTIVADAFADAPLLERHRSVNRLLDDEFAGAMHALALHTYTPQEWERRSGGTPASPPCLGGDAR